MNRGWDQNQGGSRVEGNRYLLLLLMTPVTSVSLWHQSHKQPTMHHCCSSLWWQPNTQKQVVFSCKMSRNHRGTVYHHSKLTIRIESQNTVALLYLSPHLNKVRQLKPPHRFQRNHPKSGGRTFSRTVQTPAAVGQKQDQYLHWLTWLFPKWQQFWSCGAEVKRG